jgi:signal transduction histidine kinase
MFVLIKNYTNLIMMPLSYIRYCWFFLFLTVVKGFSQENYIAKWYTADNNELPQSSVNAIISDKYNFIWLTTQNGLVRYDGNAFRTFNTSTTNLEYSRFFDIFGSIKKDSLVCYNEGRKEQVLIHKGKIQITKKDNPILNKSRNGRHFFSHDGLPSNKTVNPKEPYFIKLSNGNYFFIDTENVELCNAKMKSIYKEGYKSKTIFNFFVLHDILFYLHEDGHYDCFSQNGKSSGKLNPALFTGKPKFFWNITTAQVFIAIKNKIYLLADQSGQLSITPIVNYKEFEKSNIISLYLDRKNQKLYLGSSTNGLCIISFPEFNTVKKDLQKTEVYYGALPLNDSTIITARGEIFNNKRLIDSISFEKNTFLDEEITIAKDNDQNLWVGRDMGVHCYLKKSAYKKHLTYPFGQNIKTLFRDHNNNIWVSAGLNEFKKAKLYCIKNGNIKLITILDYNINYIAQYDFNTLYLGTTNGLLKYQINSDQLIYVKNTEKINIRSIFIDSEKKTWLTTYQKGFFLYSDNILHSFPKDENNYLNSSHCIIEDKKGFFWIPTNKGLFQISRLTLLNYSKKKTHVIYYHQYNKFDGFLTNEFNGGCQPCGNFLKNDQIALPSMNGFVFFDPYKVVPLLPGKVLFIDKVLVDQETIQPKDTIKLKNNFQRVRFFISYPYYGNQENLNFEAKLDKAPNSRWEKLKNEKSISFTTLPPGEYILTIRTLAGFNAGYVYKRVTIIVPAQFHQTIWFTILCYLLAALFILFIWYVRLYYIRLNNIRLKEVIAKKTKKLATTVRKLKTTRNNLKQEIKQQETLVKSISHDIKSPLKFLTHSINHLADNETIQEDSKLKKQLGTIQMSTIQLYEYVENLIKYSSIFIEGKKLEDQHYSLYNLIEEKIQIFKKIAEAENIEIVNSVHQDLEIRTNNKALSIIVHNLLDNAIKNSSNGRIELFSGTKDNILMLTIIDNGKGMSRELIDYYLDFYQNPIVKNYHLGLHMIIELLLIIEGSINIHSTLNEGTTIEIMVEYN